MNNLIELKSFNIFSEYFLGIGVLYMLIVTVLISYNVLGLIIQCSLSNCIGLILILACYLIINDDLFFCNDNFNFFVFKGFCNSILTDYFGFFSKLVLCFFSSVYFFVISDFLKNYNLTAFEYLLIILFAVIGLLLLCISNDLLSAYLTLELISLSSYILASFKKNSSYSVEAGIKYLITGSISSAFFLLGSSFIYASVGTIYLSDFWVIFSELVWLAEFDKTAECFEYLEPCIEIGLIFILVSLFIKLALAPFHLWSLDVYEGSPSISTFFFAVITKLSVFIFLTRVYYSAIIFKELFEFYILIVSLLSIFVGALGGLRQKKLKTLLAYSSISHMGYALLSFSAGTKFGLEMFIFYIVIYMFSGIIVWFIVLSVYEFKKHYSDKSNKELGDFILLKESNPALAVSLSIAMFSIAGIPPLVGFFAKLCVFLSILYVEYYVVALFVILCSVISSFYYIRIIKILYFENVLVGKLYYPIRTNKIVFFTLSVFALFFLFLNPTLICIVINNIIWRSFYLF